MITDPFFYLCAIPAVLIFGIAKGGFGGGVAVISVPLMALATSPVTAAAILLPILLVMDIIAMWVFRGNWSRSNIKLCLPGAIGGVVLGAFLFRYLSDDAVRILIGMIAVLFCLHYWIKHNGLAIRKPGIWRNTIWGGMAGFASFGVHSGGPLLSVLLLPQGLDKRTLMGTFAVFFAVINAIKIIPYAWLGQLNTENLATSMVLMPLAPAGVRVGYYLLNKVSEYQIYRLCYVFLFIVGFKLLYEGFQGVSQCLSWD